MEVAQNRYDQAQRLVNPEEVEVLPMYLRFRNRPERTCPLGLDTMKNSFVSTRQVEKHACKCLLYRRGRKSEYMEFVSRRCKATPDLELNVFII